MKRAPGEAELRAQQMRRETRGERPNCRFTAREGAWCGWALLPAPAYWEHLGRHSPAREESSDEAGATGSHNGKQLPPGWSWWEQLGSARQEAAPACPAAPLATSHASTQSW